MLSAALIVRDEESHLPTCLESIRELADEIVVVDTGSTDSSVEIARSFGARVEVHPWQGDFAQARNLGLDLARGTWILHIDADEWLRPVSQEAVRATLEQASEVAFRVLRRPFAGATPQWVYRLWRADSRIRFDGMVHESVSPAIRSVSEHDRLPIGDLELYLEHVGYDGDQTRKHERYVPILRAQLAVDPSSAYNWTRLAVALAALGEAGESEVARDQAVQAARKDPASPGGALAFAEMVRRRRERGEGADELLGEALALYPGSIALAWQKVCTEIEAERYEVALGWLERLDLDPEMPVEDTISYPATLIGADAPAARGLCLFRLGHYRAAAAAYRQAEEFQPDEPTHRVKRAVAEHRAGLQRPVDAQPYR